MTVLPGATNEFDRLLEYLKRTRSFDFTAYKRASLIRRVEKRMQMVGGRVVQRLHRLPRSPS